MTAMHTKNEQGFTLIELIIVIAVSIVLLAGLLDLFSGYEALSDPSSGARPHRAGRAIAQGGRT